MRRGVDRQCCFGEVFSNCCCARNQRELRPSRLPQQQLRRSAPCSQPAATRSRNRIPDRHTTVGDTGRRRYIARYGSPAVAALLRPALPRRRARFGVTAHSPKSRAPQVCASSQLRLAVGMVTGGRRPRSRDKAQLLGLSGAWLPSRTEPAVGSALVFSCLRSTSYT